VAMPCTREGSEWCGAVVVVVVVCGVSELRATMDRDDVVGRQQLGSCGDQDDQEGHSCLFLPLAIGMLVTMSPLGPVHQSHCCNEAELNLGIPSKPHSMKPQSHH
jgi:hypothetical protein